MTRSLFREFCAVVLKGSQYIDLLRGEYTEVRVVVPAVAKLFKRLVVNCEPCLRGIFHRAQCLAGIKRMLINLQSSDTQGDFAIVLDWARPARSAKRTPWRPSRWQWQWQTAHQPSRIWPWPKWRTRNHIHRRQWQWLKNRLHSSRRPDHAGSGNKGLAESVSRSNC